MTQSDLLSFGVSQSRTNGVVTFTTNSLMAWNDTQLEKSRDISDSMIKKFPGEKRFMGNHLEIVCLMQAAQIQRLSQTLEDFRQRYKEIGKGTLDRHSYQIQVKQLSDIIQSIKNQNKKLKDLINKQQVNLKQTQRELSNYLKFKNKTSDNEQILNAKYERALSQIQKMYEDNSALQDEKNIILKEMQSRNLQISRLRIDSLNETKKHKVILCQTKDQFSLQMNKLEECLNSREAQIETLKQQKNALENSIKQSQLIIFSSLQESQKSSQKIRQLQQILKKHRSQNDKIQGFIQNVPLLQGKVRDYEQKMTAFCNQIERLNSVVEKQDYEHKKMVQQLKGWQQRKTTNDKYIQELQNIVQMEHQTIQQDIMQKDKVIHDFERQIKKLEVQVKSLDSQNKRKALIIDQKQSIINSLSSSMHQSSASFKNLANQKNRILSTLSAYEHSINNLKDELQRKNNLIVKLQDSNISQGQLRKTIQIYQEKVKQLSDVIQSERNSQKQMIEAREDKINELLQALESQKTILGQIQQENKILRQQQQALNIRLQHLTTQELNLINDTNKQLYRAKTQNQQRKKLDEQVKHKAEHTIRQNIRLARLLDERETEVSGLKNKLQQIFLTKARTQNSQSSLTQILKEVEKTHHLLTDKNYQCERLVQQLRKAEVSNQDLKTQMNSIRMSFEQMISEDQLIRSQQDSDPSSAKSILEKILEITIHMKSLSQGGIESYKNGQMQIYHQLKLLTDQSKSVKKYSSLKDLKQISNLSQELNQRNQQISLLTKQIKFVNQRLNQSLQSSPEHKELVGKIIGLTKENVELKKQLERLSENYVDKAEQYQAQVFQLRNQIQLSKVKDPSNQKEYQKNIQLLLGELKQKEQQIEDLIKQVEEAQKVISITNHQLSQQIIDLNYYKGQYQNLTHQIQQYGSKLKEQTQRSNQQALTLRQNLQDQIRNRQSEINKLKLKLAQHQYKQQENEEHTNRKQEELKLQIEQFEDSKRRTEIQLDKQHNELESVTKQKNRLKETIEDNLKEQIKTHRKIQSIQSQNTRRLQQLDQEHAEMVQIIMEKNQKIKQLELINRKSHDDFDQVMAYKSKTGKQITRLEKQLAVGQSRIQELSQQIQESQKFARSIVQICKAFQLKVNSMEEQLRQGQQLHQRAIEHQQLIEKYQHSLNNLQIQNDFYKHQLDKNKKMLTYFDQKTKLVSQQFMLVEQHIYELKKENVSLRSQNYDINIENEKSKIFPHRVHLKTTQVKVLSDEITRLEKENISLFEQTNLYKLSIGEETSYTSRFDENLALFVLLFAQIESLRERLITKEEQTQVADKGAANGKFSFKR